jgi:Fe-S-cluster-containing hydrogenase component 2
MKIHRNESACYGCRSCELACSFHRHSSFEPGGGAIRVRKDNRTGQIRWTMGPDCDLCKGRDRPLCVRFCCYDALQVIPEGALDG